MGERGGSPQTGIRTQDARSATALYVGTLPTRLLAPTKFVLHNIFVEAVKFCQDSLNKINKKPNSIYLKCKFE